MRSHQSRACSAPKGNDSNADAGMFLSDLFHVSGEVALDHATASTPQDDSTPQKASEPDGITYFDYNPHVAILDQVDLHTRVANGIDRFFACLTQSSEQVISSRLNILEHVNSYSPYVRAFIENYSHTSLAKASITAMYETIVTYEASFPEDYRIFTEHIPCLSNLLSVIKGLQADRLFKEVWMMCTIALNDIHFHIHLKIPINTTCTFGALSLYFVANWPKLVQVV